MRLITTIALALLGLTTWAQTSLPDLPAGAQRYSQTLWIVPSDSTLWTGATGNYAQVATREQLRQLASQGYTKAQVDSAITSQIGLIDFPVTSVNSMTGAVVVAKADIGLGNVDNTTDLDKPISTATQGALDGKENAFSKGSLVAGTGVTLSGTLANRLVGSGNVTINASNPLTASNGLQINSGVISPVYGTSANTVAQGNDSRINNGQTAYDRGDFRDFGLGVNMPPVTNADVLTGNRFFSTTSAHAFGFGSGVQFHRQESELRAGQIHIANGPSVTEPIVKVRAGYTGGWGPIRTLWHDGNFTPSNYLLTSARGAANGVASLDGSGKVPSSQLPTGGMQYQGTWNASTNSPTLSNATGTDGHFYRVTTAGTQNLGSGNITFSVGDDVIHNGSVWQRAPSGTTSTNLAIGTRTATTMPITNSNGTGLTLPSATTSLAGLLSAADKTKLNAALTDFTETDPTVPAHVKAITSGNISNWNTAYGWGNHASANYFSTNFNIAPSATQFAGDFNSLPLGSYAAGISTLTNNRPHTDATGGFISFGSTDNANQVGRLVTGRAGSDEMWYSNGIATNPYYRVASREWVAANYLTSANFTWSNLSGKPSTFAPSPHTHNASDIDAGTLSIARLPTGTTGSTVALGNHSHTFAQITSKPTTLAGYGITDAVPSSRQVNSGTGLTGGGNLSQNRTLSVNFGTAANTVAQGNDSRIVNGQTAYDRGDFRDFGLGVNLPAMSSADGLTGNQFFSTASSHDFGFGSGIHFQRQESELRAGQIHIANGSSTTEPIVKVRAGATDGWGAIRTIWHDGNLPSPASFGTAGSQVRTNTQLDARYVQSIGAGSGISVSGTTVSVDNTVVRTSGNQSISGNKTFNSPTVAPQYQSTSTTITGTSIATNTHSLFKASISANTNYTLTNLTGNPRHIQVIITNTATTSINVTFNAKMPINQNSSVGVGQMAVFTFLIEDGVVFGTKTLYTQ